MGPQACLTMRRNHVFFLCIASVSLAIVFGHELYNKEKRDLLRRYKRRWVLSTIELIEEEHGNYPREVTQLFNDKDTTLKFKISGEGVTTDPIGLFSINEYNGSVYVHAPIDRETHPSFHIRFDVVDRITDEPVDITLAFDVNVQDKNDNAPQFTPPNLRGNVSENQEEGLLPMSLQIQDIDERDTDNSRISLKLISQEPLIPRITLQEMDISMPGDVTGKLSVHGCFDYDTTKSYKLLVEAWDHGTPRLSSTSTVIIDIVDSNSHQPEFTEKTYKAELMELASNKELIRVKVTDKDTPQTPGWRAVYSITKGNSGARYKIETDPETNEGVLTVIQEKNYKTTHHVILEIAVKNEEPLFMCKSGVPVKTLPAPQTATVNLTIIDSNDAPVFEKPVYNQFQKEEEEPGQIMYSPVVTDEDSKNIRFELADDMAGWLTIDEKTGQVKTIKRLDRESPYVKDDIYTVVVKAIDDGAPPATSSSTLHIHLGDKNDNKPYLLSNHTILCGNKDNQVKVMAGDKDAHPYGGPFSFTVGGEDEEMKKRWKLEPSTGTNSSLISLRSLANGRYTVPLNIMDQQGKVASEVLLVVVCDCGKGQVCGRSQGLTSRLGPGGIGLLFAALLLLLLLLCLCLLCQCNKNKFKHLPLNLQDQGNQTLIKYNEEGGGVPCTSDPIVMVNPGGVTVVDHPMVSSNQSQGAKGSWGQGAGRSQGGSGTWGHGGAGRSQGGGGTWGHGGAGRSQGGSGTWGHGGAGRFLGGNGTLVSVGRGNNGRTKHSGSFNVMADQELTAHIQRKICELPEDQFDFPGYGPHDYAYEGRSSKSFSLDELSLSQFGDDQTFIQRLGPKFNVLDGVCSTAIKEKNLKF